MTGILLGPVGTKMSDRYSPKDSRGQNGNQQAESHMTGAKRRELGGLGAQSTRQLGE